jgi:DNA ligase-1
VRAIWDGKQLRFRSGRLIQAPAWFIAALPAHPLDGELWMGRRRFEALSAAVRRQIPDEAEWRQISYQIYELPEGSGSFSERLVTLRQSIAGSQAPWLQVLAQQRQRPRRTAGAVEKNRQRGAEGLMLHQADAVWQTGRSDVLLKLKLHLDAEAVVIGHEPGRGKYQGLLGALLVQTPEGQRFRLGSGLSDAQRQSPPAIGSTVTYRYRDLNANGIPKFATFLRVRESE